MKSEIREPKSERRPKFEILRLRAGILLARIWQEQNERVSHFWVFSFPSFLPQPLYVNIENPVKFIFLRSRCLTRIVKLLLSANIEVLKNRFLSALYLACACGSAPDHTTASLTCARQLSTRFTDIVEFIDCPSILETRTGTKTPVHSNTENQIPINDWYWRTVTSIKLYIHPSGKPLWNLIDTRCTLLFTSSQRNNYADYQ